MILRYCDHLHGRWRFLDFRAIFLRRYMLQYTSFELFLRKRHAIMFAFDDFETVKKVIEHLPPIGIGVKYGLPQSHKTSLMTPKQLYKHSDLPQRWQKREINNFEYLMFLNTIAGRTYNDLNQYPVFPWVLSNYTTQTIDLREPNNFRDLTKPIGALTEQRKKFYTDRFNSWQDETIPPFHFGTHYSTEAFTLNWMFRQEPFTSIFLDLQSGKFDHSDRLFHSMEQAWENCQKNPQDVKELIPELFYLPEMFRNSNGYDLGKRDDGTLVNEVILPPWANGSPEKFVQIHREALESDLVSCQLNQWIDLIFGFKQKGVEAIRNTNVFYYLSYEGSVNQAAIEDPIIRQGIERQILSFGQTPVQLLTTAHQPRYSIMSMSPLAYKPLSDDLCMLLKFISNSSVCHISANTNPSLPHPTLLAITQSLVFSLNKWNHAYSSHQSSHSMAPNTISGSKDDKSEGTNQSKIPELPLIVDPLLAIGNPTTPISKRHLGDSFDQRFPITSSNFVTSVDSKVIIACGYPDYSFRVIDSETATVKQVIYGHGDVVTCISRSEPFPFMDCILATGSIDCTVVLWYFSCNTNLVSAEYEMAAGEGPVPKAILTGHDSQITAIVVSTENGLIVSGSKDGAVLMHTLNGELLRRIQSKDLPGLYKNQNLPPVSNILMNRDCFIVVIYNQEDVATFTSTGMPLNEPLHRSVEKICSSCMSRDGDYIVIGSEQGRVSILRLFPLQMLYTYQQTDSVIRSLAISTNQSFILAGLDSGAIVVFNVDFNKWRFEYKPNTLKN
uniref:Neurobeachin n=1 Tax=Rhabditophanes sp. KR3021 TaxID=114890 RepID=A0AC35TXP6_9BILA